MDTNFDEILETILENNEENTLFIQLCFYCFRSFIENRIVDESLELDWNNLQELCEKYCDEEWKPYINDFFETNFWIKKHQIIRKLTPEEIEEYKIKESQRKYNL